LRSKLSVLAAIIVVALIGIAVVAFNGSGPAAVSVGNAPGFTVRRGPLTISVSESGTIQAREQIILKSEVEGRTTILFLVEEGTRVKTGELLVELDSSQLIDDRIEQEIRVQNAEASFIRARENLAVAKNQAESDIDRAELDLEFAKLDLKKYIEGEYLNQRKEVESRITLAREELEAAEEKLKWSRVLFEKEYISQRELQVDELAAHQKQLDLELAENNLNLLESFTHPRNLAELESDVRQAEMALERTNRKAKADVVQAEADLRARESEFNRQKDKLEKNGEQIEKTKIYAPADGLVSKHWRSSDEPLDEGQEVREREELIYLPTADAVKAEVKIHEASLEKIKAGLGVTVTVDALPGRTFTGEVAKIAPLPDAQMVWLNPDLKVYNTEIYLDGEGNNLRTGMSCRAEIIIEEYEDAIYIPVQAVIRVGDEPTVYVWDGGGFEPRTVEVGLDNNRMMRILGGLKEGEVVLLTPPLGSGTVEQGREAVTRAPGAGEGSKTRGKKPAEKRKRQRPDMKNLTDEQKQKMRERYEKMSDEEKEKMRQERMKKGGQRRGAGE
jgi:HlyD family secretion protein